MKRGGLTAPPAWRLLLIGGLLLGLVVALQPYHPEPGELPHFDKVKHIAAFLVFGLMAQRAWPDRLLAPLLGLLAYGGLVEIGQGLLTTTRSASWADLLADAFGLLLAWGWAAWRLRQAPRPAAG